MKGKKKEDFDYQNFDRPRSSLKYKTPAAFENLNQNLYFRVALINEG